MFCMFFINDEEEKRIIRMIFVNPLSHYSNKEMMQKSEGFSKLVCSLYVNKFTHLILPDEIVINFTLTCEIGDTPTAVFQDPFVIEENY